MQVVQPIEEVSQFSEWQSIVKNPSLSWIPAQEGQDIAISVKGTEFYKVVSHPLKINHQDKEGLSTLFSHLKKLIGTAAQCGKGLFGNFAKQLFRVHLNS